MMKHKVKDFHLVAFLQLTVLAISHTIAVITKVLQCEPTVWEIGNFYMSSRQQIGRTDFIVRGAKVGIAIILYL